MYIFRKFTSRLRLLAYSTGLVSLASCSQDVFETPIVPVESTDGQISVLYEVEGDIPLTRGIAALDHEKTLEHVHILYFDSENGDKYAACTKAPAGSNTIKFDPPETLQPNTEYRVLVVGNANDHEGKSDAFTATLNSLTTEDDYNKVRGLLLAYADESVVDPENLPLCGRFVDPATDNELHFCFSRTEEGIQIPYGEGKSIFRFQRAICRVDLHNLVANILDIRYVRLVNTKDRGHYFFDGLNLDNYHELNFVEDAKSPGFVELPEKEEKEQLQRLEAKLYCFPNTVNTCLPNDEKTTALMIAGYYTDPETGKKDPELTYYRFNISNAGEAQTLQRNYCYRATIKGVKRKGKDNELDAFKETSPVFVYDIGEEWNTDDDNVVTDEFGNFLVVSKSLLTFTGDQCGADVVKLSVNTSDGMEWTIEMDDESKKYFQAQPIAAAPGEKIQAFSCGPKQTNYSEYYYEGSLTIVAKNKNTGRELRKEVRLVQLTTNGDVKCLIVNDYTTSFAQEVSKYGQTISYKVITGNPTNRWTAKDEKGKTNGWSDEVSFTERGTNGNYFTITFPANIGEKRSVDIKFEFDCGVPEENSKIKPIVVTFTQDVCDQPLVIEGWPADAEMTLNCFDTRTGWEYANCVAQARKFTVHLQRPDEHYFEVTSSFNQYRDLTLGHYNGCYGHYGEVRSIYPDLKYIKYTGAEATDKITDDIKDLYNNKLDNKESTNDSFYINAFRMGPGDPTIEGSLTVQVKSRSDGSDISNGRLTLTIRLIVPSDEYMLNDVMIKNDITSDGEAFKEKDNGWIYVMDRNIGCDARMHTDASGKTYFNYAKWCFWDEGTDTDPLEITNTVNDQKWLGSSPLEFPKGNVGMGTILDNYLQNWTNELKDIHKHLGYNYKYAERYPWTPFTPSSMPAIRNNMAISKGRCFLLADPEVCPTNSKGSKINVACWFPSGYHVGYLMLNEGWLIQNRIAFMPIHSKLEKLDFWNQYSASNYQGGYAQTHLVRLLYLIGCDMNDFPKALNNVPPLPVDSIAPQLQYYKDHILKCYEAQ